MQFTYNTASLFEMFFYRDSNKNEIDLVIEAAQALFLFEVKMKQNVDKRDFRVLDAFPELERKVQRFIVSVYKENIALSKRVKNLQWFHFPEKLKDIL